MGVLKMLGSESVSQKTEVAKNACVWLVSHPKEVAGVAGGLAGMNLAYRLSFLSNVALLSVRAFGTVEGFFFEEIMTNFLGLHSLRDSFLFWNLNYRRVLEDHFPLHKRLLAHGAASMSTAAAAGALVPLSRRLYSAVKGRIAPGEAESQPNGQHADEEQQKAGEDNEAQEPLILKK